MHVPEWLRTYAALEEADGLELAPKQLCDIAKRYEAMEQALDFVVDRENLMFAECTDAEEILDVCRPALAAARAPLEDMSQEGGVA